MLARLNDPTQRDRIRQDMDDPAAITWENQWHGSGGGDGVMISTVLNPDLRKYEGMTLTAIGKAMGKDPRDAVMDLVIADRDATSVITSIMNEDDVRTALRAPARRRRAPTRARRRKTAAVGIEIAPARVGIVSADSGPLRRDEHLLPLEEAVRKMTSKAATRVHLNDRGVLRPGLKADIAIFDAGDHSRRLDVRGSEALLDGRAPRVRQRPPRVGRRRDDGGAAGPAAARAGIQADAGAAEDGGELIAVPCRSGSSICSRATATPPCSSACSSRTSACRCPARRCSSRARRWRASVSSRCRGSFSSRSRGATLGDNLGFFIGRHGGRAIAERHGWRVGFTKARLAEFDQVFCEARAAHGVHRAVHHRTARVRCGPRGRQRDARGRLSSSTTPAAPSSGAPIIAACGYSAGPKLGDAREMDRAHAA